MRTKQGVSQLIKVIIRLWSGFSEWDDLEYLAHQQRS